MAAYSQASFGVVGLGVMGSMLALNLAEKTGESIAGFELDPAKAKGAEAKATKEGLGSAFKAYTDLKDFVNALTTPRRIVLLVPAGKPVDSALAALGPLLDKGDCVVDGGNEWYENTERRAAQFSALGLHYVGCGVSGGAEGARHGPSLMAGGPREAFDLLEPTLKKIAAQVDGPCLGYFGSGGAGNYVKMVHNGIEYGDMQLIGEAFLLLKNTQNGKGLSRTTKDCARIFDKYNRGKLKSFLVEITAGLLKKRDDRSDSMLVDQVLDSCGSKGTGKWTVQEFADKGVACGTVAAALEARYLSALVAQRRRFASIATVGVHEDLCPRIPENVLEDALLCAKICSYAQGMSLIRTTALAKGWSAEPDSVLRCWQGGCIIRADLLKDFRKAYADDPSLENLLMHPSIVQILNKDRIHAWRAVVGVAVQRGLPVPALSASLAYYDSLRRPYLENASLIQAQRDCFGGHTYRRRDDPDGTHTTQWLA
jgi:6-phosphogluconate dehydrogenase